MTTSDGAHFAVGTILEESPYYSPIELNEYVSGTVDIGIPDVSLDDAKDVYRTLVKPLGGAEIGLDNQT